MKFVKKLKKSQKIHINHFSQNSCVTIFTTVRQYPTILDCYTCKVVEKALEYLMRTFADETTIENDGITLQVILVDH